MGQSNLIAFIIENRVVIVVLLLFLLVLLTALIFILIYTVISNIQNSLDNLKSNQDKQTKEIISLEEKMSELSWGINSLGIDRSQIEMLYEQKNIISYFKKEILPEQVLVFFAANSDRKIYSIVIENQNKFYTLNNVSLSVNYTEIGCKNMSESLKKISDLIELVKNVSIAPEERYTIPLNNIPYREIFKRTNICFIEVHIAATYNVDGKQKDLSVTVPCFLTYRYRTENYADKTRITNYNF